MESGLYVVATPIGNLGDISHRALEVLRSADIVAAEDTRHSLRLMQHFSIDVPVIAYHDHSHERARERIDRCLEADGRVALISDAGTPLISDPGYRLVRHVQDLGYKVYPIPGACAAIAALSVSGLATDRFFFEGFLPARAGAREARLRRLADEEATLVFYEAPHRIEDCLDSLLQVFGPQREAVLAREVTKAFETVRRAELAELLAFVRADANQRRGEIVLLVAGRPRGEKQLSTETATLLERLAQELPARKAAAIVAEYSGLKKNELYNYLLSKKEPPA